MHDHKDHCLISLMWDEKTALRLDASNCGCSGSFMLLQIAIEIGKSQPQGFGTHIPVCTYLPSAAGKNLMSYTLGKGCIVAPIKHISVGRDTGLFLSYGRTSVPVI